LLPFPLDISSSTDERSADRRHSLREKGLLENQVQGHHMTVAGVFEFQQLDVARAVGWVDLRGGEDTHPDLPSLDTCLTGTKVNRDLTSTVLLAVWATPDEEWVAQAAARCFDAGFSRAVIVDVLDLLVLSNRECQSGVVEITRQIGNVSRVGLFKDVECLGRAARLNELYNASDRENIEIARSATPLVWKDDAFPPAGGRRILDYAHDLLVQDRFEDIPVVRVVHAGAETPAKALGQQISSLRRGDARLSRPPASAPVSVTSDSSPVSGARAAAPPNRPRVAKISIRTVASGIAVLILCGVLGSLLTIQFSKRDQAETVFGSTSQELNSAEREIASLKSQLEAEKVALESTTKRATALALQLDAPRKEGISDEARQERETQAARVQQLEAEKATLSKKLAAQADAAGLFATQRDTNAERAKKLEADLSSARQEVTALQSVVKGLQESLAAAPANLVTNDNHNQRLQNDRFIAVNPLSLRETSQITGQQVALVEAGDRLIYKGPGPSDEWLQLETEAGKSGYAMTNSVQRETDWLENLTQAHLGTLKEVGETGVVTLESITAPATGKPIQFKYKLTGIGALTRQGVLDANAWASGSSTSTRCIEMRVPSDSAADRRVVTRCFIFIAGKRYDLGELLIRNKWVKALTTDAPRSYQTSPSGPR
jgi:hypothetical protein